MVHNETTKPYFLDWQDVYEKEKPYQVIMTDEEQISDEFKDTNLVFSNDYQEQLISDIRGRENDFCLDQNGFAIVKQQTAVTFKDEKEIDDVYIPEIEKLMQQEVGGADRVFIFDWRVCLSLPTWVQLGHQRQTKTS
jgi:hypothetical protein